MTESEIYYPDYSTYSDQITTSPSIYLFNPRPPLSISDHVTSIPVLDEPSIFQGTAKNVTIKKFPVHFIELYSLSDLQVDFKVPIRLAYSYEPDKQLHFFQISDLNISYSDSDYETCLNEVVEEILVLWKEIVLAEDSDLTSDALRIKRFFLSIKK
jgi:hypothetical protein